MKIEELPPQLKAIIEDEYDYFSKNINNIDINQNFHNIDIIEELQLNEFESFEKDTFPLLFCAETNSLLLKDLYSDFKNTLDINKSNSKGITTLMGLARDNNSIEIEQLLKIDGVNPYLTDNKGMTALDYADFDTLDIECDSMDAYYVLKKWMEDNPKENYTK